MLKPYNVLFSLHHAIDSQVMDFVRIFKRWRMYDTFYLKRFLKSKCSTGLHCDFKKEQEYSDK